MLKTVLVLGVFAHPQDYRIPVTASEIKNGFPDVSVSDREEHELYYTERDVNDGCANMFGGLHGDIMEVKCSADIFLIFVDYIVGVLTGRYCRCTLTDDNGDTVFVGNVKQTLKWLGLM